MEFVIGISIGIVISIGIFLYIKDHYNIKKNTDNIPAKKLAANLIANYPNELRKANINIEIIGTYLHTEEQESYKKIIPQIQLIFEEVAAEFNAIKIINIDESVERFNRIYVKLMDCYAAFSKIDNAIHEIEAKAELVKEKHSNNLLNLISTRQKIEDKQLQIDFDISILKQDIVDIERAQKNIPSLVAEKRIIKAFDDCVVGSNKIIEINDFIDNKLDNIKKIVNDRVLEETEIPINIESMLNLYDSIQEKYNKELIISIYGLDIEINNYRNNRKEAYRLTRNYIDLGRYIETYRQFILIDNIEKELFIILQRLRELENGIECIKDKAKEKLLRIKEIIHEGEEYNTIIRPLEGEKVLLDIEIELLGKPDYNKLLQKIDPILTSVELSLNIIKKTHAKKIQKAKEDMRRINRYCGSGWLG